MFRFYFTYEHSLRIAVSMEAEEFASSFQLGVAREMLHIVVFLSAVIKET